MQSALTILMVMVALFCADVARADLIEARTEYIVNGDPVARDGLRGTVRVTLVDPDVALEEVTPIALHPFFSCTGVLIAPSVVATAAHCLDDCAWESCTSSDECDCEPELWPAQSIFITPGVRGIDDLRRAEAVAVREAIVPEDYERFPNWRADFGECEPYGNGALVCTEPGLSSSINDVALLLLAEPIEILFPVQLLSDAEGIEGTYGVATGYGERTVDDTELLDQDEYDSLLHETMTMIELLTEHEILTDAGENQGGVCDGDSGGPLYVERGGRLFVAGIASRLRTDRAPPRCGKGSIYTSIPAHVPWIEEQAPEVAAFQFDEGSGCSVSRKPSPSTGLWLAGLLILSLRMRGWPTARGGAIPVAILGFLAASSSSCGSSDELSFCTERYDPLGVACDPNVERTDLQTADSLARSRIPEDAWLWEVRGPSSHLDPDGEGADWTLTYLLRGEADPASGKALPVRVRGHRVDEVLEPLNVQLFCIPMRPIEPFDSRRIMQDAIRRIEDTGVVVQIIEAGDLGLVQNHRCASPSLRLNAATYRAAGGFYSVGYDEHGEFLEIRTP
ncbi:MAG: trypsin-like serine protease [Myxococcales bacterium]|nr:trypsin-like serine protease [Myxococcales bacterium]